MIFYPVAQANHETFKTSLPCWTLLSINKTQWFCCLDLASLSFHSYCPSPKFCWIYVVPSFSLTALLALSYLVSHFSQMDLFFTINPQKLFLSYFPSSYCLKYKTDLLHTAYRALKTDSTPLPNPSFPSQLQFMLYNNEPHVISWTDSCCHALGLSLWLSYCLKSSFPKFLYGLLPRFLYLSAHINLSERSSTALSPTSMPFILYSS